jgi:hypothetical protein
MSRLGPIPSEPKRWRVDAIGHPCHGATGIEVSRHLTERGHARVTLNMERADGTAWPFPLAVTLDAHQLRAVRPAQSATQRDIERRNAWLNTLADALL